jgi:AraC-like DNA-binding protein
MREHASVAEDVGYESEAAFNRAFKREFDMPSATWRRNVAGFTNRDKGRASRAVSDHH